MCPPRKREPFELVRRGRSGDAARYLLADAGIGPLRLSARNSFEPAVGCRLEPSRWSGKSVSSRWRACPWLARAPSAAGQHTITAWPVRHGLSRTAAGLRQLMDRYGAGSRNGSYTSSLRSCPVQLSSRRHDPAPFIGMGSAYTRRYGRTAPPWHRSQRGRRLRARTRRATA